MSDRQLNKPVFASQELVGGLSLVVHHLGGDEEVRIKLKVLG